MQAKQRDAAPNSRYKHSTIFKIVSRVCGAAIVAGIFVWIPLLFGARIAGAGSALLFSCLLLTASVWDICKRIIPDSLCVLIALTGLLTFAPAKLLGVLLSLPLLIAALIKEGGMGGGDIKLTAACGFVLGLPLGCAGLVMGLTAAVLWHLAAKAAQKLNHHPKPAVRTALPLAPFLSIGFVAAIIIL